MHKIKKLQWGGGPLNSTSGSPQQKYIDTTIKSVWPIKSITSVLPYTPMKSLPGTIKSSLDTGLETSKLTSMANKYKGVAGATAASKLTSGFNIGSAGLDLLGSFAKPLDHTSGASAALGIAGDVAGMIPGPWGQGISAGLKAIKLVDQLTGKKANAQITQGASATGYNLDFNTNAGTSYGGLFGNKKRKQANTLSSKQDVQNITKMYASNKAQQDLLGAQNATQSIEDKNYKKLMGGLGTNILAAKEGLKITEIVQKAKYLADGGKVNVIPSGALHKELNHLDGDHTKKGIPVLLEESGGQLTQQAEIERDEIILNLDLTKKLEELHKQYEDGNEEAAIEAGKLLTYEILDNTQDNTGLIDKIQ